MSILEWLAAIALLPHVIGTSITCLVLVFMGGAAGYITFSDWRAARRRMRERSRR